MKDLEKEHKRIVSEYDKVKSNQLEKLADQMLKNDKEREKLKKYNVSPDIFDLFS